MTEISAKFALPMIALVGAAALSACGAHHGMSPASMAPPAQAAFMAGPERASGEEYDAITENRFHDPRAAPLSTFSIDVDTAAYSNVRRFLNQGELPPRDAVRIEELINYFSYEYPQPTGDAPFSVVTEVAPAPWKAGHHLVHIGLQGRRVDTQDMPPRNLVFLLDVSGSMGSANKLPLLKDALTLLVEQLNERDRVSIVVYAGASGMVLAPTPGHHKQDIIGAMRQLRAGGGTNGAAGIELAYQLAEQNFDPAAVNRVILATDGDFNVGVSSRSGLIELIEAKRKSGIYLTVLGLGMGNLKDSTMEQLADKGNGNYAYIDSIAEARKVLVDEAGGTLITLAKDVKIQVEFNRDLVASYRLIGYENRLMDNRDFADDSKDAGEIGAGHTVTALYEVALRQDRDGIASAAATGEDSDVARDDLLTVRLRYKQPDSAQSALLTSAVANRPVALSDSSDAFRFSAAVAGFGMLLRGSEHRGSATFASVRELASGALGADRAGYRKGFLSLVERAGLLAGGQSAPRAARA
ncbi:MAG: VWA domain-containing protein, partial [Myxococcota bacterium]